MPAWLIGVVALGVIGLAALAWRAMDRPAAPVGKDIPVRPGMYDFRAEMAKGRGETK